MNKPKVYTPIVRVQLKVWGLASYCNSPRCVHDISTRIFYLNLNLLIGFLLPPPPTPIPQKGELRLPLQDNRSLKFTAPVTTENIILVVNII